MALSTASGQAGQVGESRHRIQAFRVAARREDPVADKTGRCEPHPGGAWELTVRLVLVPRESSVDGDLAGQGLTRTPTTG